LAALKRGTQKKKEGAGTRGGRAFSQGENKTWGRGKMPTETKRSAEETKRRETVH